MLFGFLVKLWRLHQSGSLRARYDTIKDDIATASADAAEVKGGLTQAITALGKELAQTSAIHDDLTKLGGR